MTREPSFGACHLCVVQIVIKAIEIGSMMFQHHCSGSASSYRMAAIAGVSFEGFSFSGVAVLPALIDHPSY